MRSMFDIAKQANDAYAPSLAGKCQQYVGLGISAFLGRAAPGGYLSAELARQASTIHGWDTSPPPGAIPYFKYVDRDGNNYGHDGLSLGNGYMASGTANPRGKVLDLGGGVFISSIAEYATSRAYLGWSLANGNRPAINGVAGWAPAVIPGPAPSTGREGYTFQMVRGDGLIYQEPTGAFANRILRAMTNWGLDPRTNSLSDGKIGTNTRKALQRYGKAKGGYAGPIDGKLGKNSIKALQRAGKAAGVYSDLIDGLPGFNTWTSVARAHGQ